MFTIVGAAFVLLWAAVKRKWRAIGFVAPDSWGKDLGLGILAGVALKLAMQAVVLPLLGARGINQAYHFLVGNTAVLPGMLLRVTVIGGFGEEILWRGFLFDRLGVVLGRSARAMVAIVLIGAVLFGLAHYHDLGLRGAVQAAITGTVFGAAYLRMGRLWPVMIAHAAFDIAAVLIIYWNLESTVAGLLFGIT